jgi:hypothetical protein
MMPTTTQTADASLRTAGELATMGHYATAARHARLAASAYKAAGEADLAAWTARQAADWQRQADRACRAD